MYSVQRKISKIRLKFLNIFQIYFLDVFFNNIGKKINLIVAFLMTRILSLILIYCVSALIVFKIHHGMHTATIKNFNASIILSPQKLSSNP